MTIKRRLAVLDNAAGGLSRFIVASGPASFDYDDEFRRGIERTERDLIVVVAKTDEHAQRTVKFDGVS